MTQNQTEIRGMQERMGLSFHTNERQLTPSEEITELEFALVTTIATKVFKQELLKYDKTEGKRLLENKLFIQLQNSNIFIQSQNSNK